MKNLKYLIIFVLIILAGGLGFLRTKNQLTGNGGIGGGQEVTGSTTPSTTAKPTPSFPKILGNFLVTDREICLENAKPIVYFFGSSSCPHCVWEKPIAQKVFKSFGSEIAYHENFDSDKDSDVFAKYADINPGYVPFFVLGCKYARVGAGENLGKDEAESKKLEEEALTAIVCKLTDNKPAGICNPLKAKISEIK